MKRAVTSLCFAVLFVAGSVAQQTVNNPDPATREQALKMIDLVNIDAQISAMSAGMRQQMRPMIIDEFKKAMPNAPQAALEEVVAAYDDMFQEMFKAIAADDLRDIFAPVYQKYLTRGEAEAVIAFYASPEGQSFIKKLPGMSLEAMQAMMPKMRAQVEQINEKFKPRMEEIIKKYNLGTTTPK